MKKKTLIMAYTGWVLVAVFLVVAVAWQAEAAVITTDITIKHACISMPDGGVTAPTGTPPVTCPAGTIKMWLPADATGLLAPGSFMITAVENDTLTINLSNELAIPVSLVIPGQVLSNNTGPVWFADIAHPYTGATATGSRPAPTDVNNSEDPAYKYRVRSFSHEAPPGGPGAPGEATAYTWNSLKPGTYLILSGTHPSLQVQMGIYGVLIVKRANGAPYGDGVPIPDQEAMLLFSEIDPAIHNSADDAKMVAATPTIPSTNVFYPKYFLINGKAFPAGDPIPIGDAGSTTLLRFANAGLDTYVPLLQSQSMQVIAEDGYLKADNLRFNRYSVDLHAGKTFDALLTNPAAGYIPLYDRRLYLSNAAQAPGGMLTYLEVGGPGPSTLTVATNGSTGTGKVAAESLPGGIYCDSAVVGSNCTQDYLADTQVKLVGRPNPGSLLNGWTDCDLVTAANDCVMTVSGAKTVTANFQAFTAMRLITPNGGESIPSGSFYTVRWGAPASAVRFRLRYSLDGGTTWRLINNQITGNSFNWPVPTVRGNKTNVKVQVTGYRANGTVVGSDSSNARFRIDVVTVTSPALGQSWSSGVGQLAVPITWVSHAPAGVVKTIVIQYSKNNATTWLPVTTLDNTGGLYDVGGTYNWQIEPTVPGNRPNSFVRVTLKDAAGNIFARDASSKFIITP
jgi:FtsP/CotA-like multicopper oxidase with cupredoxin domain